VSTDRPTVLFVCVSNGGKSQMAEALMRAHVGDSASIHSAGTAPKGKINAESAASVARAGASMDAATSKPIDPDLLRTADRVIVLGRDAQVEPVPVRPADRGARRDLEAPRAAVLRRPRRAVEGGGRPVDRRGGHQTGASSGRRGPRTAGRWSRRSEIRSSRWARTAGSSQRLTRWRGSSARSYSSPSVPSCTVPGA